MDPGDVILVHLTQPTEKFWGILERLDAVGVVLRGAQRRLVRRLDGSSCHQGAGDAWARVDVRTPVAGRENLP